MSTSKPLLGGIGALVALVLGPAFFTIPGFDRNCGALAAAERPSVTKGADLRIPEHDLPDGAAPTRAAATATPPDKPLPSATVKDAATFVAIVIDTSRSMRDPVTNLPLRPVFAGVDEVLAATADAANVLVLDADGRFIPGGAKGGWLPNDPELRPAMKAAIRDHTTATKSNPEPGIVRALQWLSVHAVPGARLHLFVLGDEFTGAVEPFVRRVAEFNPADATGRRRITIHALVFETAERPGETQQRFATALRELAGQSGGTYTTVPVR